MNETERRKNIQKFVEMWRDRGDEKSDTQSFWLTLLQEVYGIAQPAAFIEFEKRVKLRNVSFIDASIPKTHVLIEQKSADVDLGRAIRQSDGSELTPFQQAERYNARLPYSMKAKWIIVCNFREFRVHDMETPDAPPVIVKLEDLETEYHVLNFMTDETQTEAYRETQLSISAGELVGRLYDALRAQYIEPDSPETLRSLNILCVRLVFCFYAEDAGILGKHNCVHTYLNKRRNQDLRRALSDLFEILNTKPEERDPYLDEDLLEFPYVNGGLFAEQKIEIPRFTPRLADLILHDCSRDFDWSGISPTIFGAVFESTLNPETRRSGGMHYTSIENIHRVIDPLFLDALKAELEEIFAVPVQKTRENRLKELHGRLGQLTFFDPACGSGNFLTETYISLRRLENDILRALTKGQMYLSEVSPVQIAIGQFYGIEINDFAVSVARTALWIAECQMLQETEDIIQKTLDFLPLRSYSNIHEGNALRMDWEALVPKEKLNFIMGNPPFVGASMMSKEQKEQAIEIFGKGPRVNSIDYVGAWYYKAAELMQNTSICAAFVSTNSITQGEQVAPLWGKLFQELGIHIDFAHKTFRWNSEAENSAQVHCVIIGFSVGSRSRSKKLYVSGSVQIVSNINAYLLDAPNIIISSRGRPICDVLKMTAGNKPADGGHLILSEKEREELLKNDKNIECCIRRYVGAQDFLNNNVVRYCLWLKDVSPSIYRKNKDILARLEAVREMRLKSSAAPTRVLAEKPYLFFSTPQTDDNYLCIPEVSSERRRYIPIGFMDKSIIASNKLLIIPNADIYYFGILTSNVHNAWMRTITGRMKSDYQYSGAVVYNNFPWPTPTDSQKQKIEETAQAILDARSQYPDCSLADLYDELTMPPELRRAHQQNDFAVLSAYGFDRKITESEIVAKLMKMYQDLTGR